MQQIVKQWAKRMEGIVIILCLSFAAVPASAYTYKNDPTAINMFGSPAQQRVAAENAEYEGHFYGQRQTGSDGVPVNRSLITMCDQEGLTNRLVKCIANIATQTAVRYFDNMAIALHSYTLAMAILAITFFGTQLLLGSIDRPGGEAFTLLIKIGFVLFVAASAEEVVTRVLGLFETVEALAMAFFSTTSDTIGEYRCRDSEAPFLVIDCILTQFINSDGSTSYNGEEFNDPAFMILLQVAAMTGLTGFLVTIALVVMLIFVLILALRCTMLYLSNIMVLVILICVAPIFTPLILFKATKDKFDKMVMKFLTTALQPLLLFVFVCFTFNVVDNLLFRHEQYSLSSILGIDWTSPDAEPPISGDELTAATQKVEDEYYYEPGTPEYEDYRQTYATEHTVTGVGDIKIEKDYLIKVEMNFFEGALERLGSAGAAVGEVIDNFIENTAEKVARNLVPIQVYRMEPMDGKTIEEVNQELLRFAVIMILILPTFIKFSEAFPNMLRQLSRSSGKPMWNTPADKIVKSTAKAAIAGGKGAVTGAVKGMMKGGPKAALAQAAIQGAQGAAKSVGKSMGKG